MRILGEIEAAEREAAAGAAPRGRLRINCHVPFGQHYLLPMLPAFLASIRRSPSMLSSLTKSSTCSTSGPTSQSARGRSRNSQPRRAQALAKPDGGGCSRRPISGSAARRPTRPTSHRPQRAWISASPVSLKAGHSSTVMAAQSTVVPPGNALVSDGESMRLLALSRLGLARLSRFHIARDIKAGALVASAGRVQSGRRRAAARHLCRPGRTSASRVRAFLDFLAANVRLPS